MFSNFPKISGLTITLEFLQPAEFNFYHEMAVDAFLRHHLGMGEDYSRYFSIITPENGRLHYTTGDLYRFAVIAIAHQKEDIQPHWRKLIRQMRGLPQNAPVTDSGVPLKDNILLRGIYDYFDGIAVSNEQSLYYWDLRQSWQQAQYWHQQLDLQNNNVKLRWQWQSCVRLLKIDHKSHKNEQRFCRQLQDLSAHLLFTRLFDSIKNLLQQLGSPIELREQIQTWQQSIAEQADLFSIGKSDLFWVDTPYYNKQQQSKTQGGMVGWMTMHIKAGAGIEPLMLLSIGQIIGTGQRRASGLGKYQLHIAAKQPWLDTPIQATNTRRAQSLLECALQADNISKAICLTEQKPGVDLLNEKTHNQIKSAIGQIRKQDYHPPQLQGFSQAKKDGSERILAVSPLYDRILQKAVALVLTPGLDALMSQASYAYRKGLSREQVRYQIQNAWREGYRWVYESDIDDFFDAINRKQLFLRLRAVLGQDPLWQLVESWMAQPVYYKNTLIERPKGIPQGSPLSPLLANFILDDFDADMESLGFKMIRFADDFIVLCKSQYQAQMAAEAVKASLAELGLSLNAEKSHIIELQQGFRFLGYLFREDHAIEIGGETRDGRNSYSWKQHPKTLPPWLANLGEKQAEKLPEEETPKQSIGTIEEQGTHIVLAGDAQTLTTDNHNLIIKKDKIITHKINWEQLNSLLLIGLHHMTLPAQQQALMYKVPVHMADRSGQYLGALTSFSPAQQQYKNWFVQMQMSDNPDYQLQFSRNLVISRIHNQRVNLSRRKAQNPQVKSVIQQHQRLINKCKHADHIASLLGLEGTATKNYYQSLNHFLPGWAKFSKRSRRPPKDPFNVMLSLGYTILYSHVDAVLQSQGFLSWKGIYHQQSPAHAALASDIMESYRHLVERFALAQVNQKRIKQKDFRHEQNPLGQNTLRMSAEARRRYVSGLINQFQKFSKQQTLHQHLIAQAKALKNSMLNYQEFHPWKESK